MVLVGEGHGLLARHVHVPGVLALQQLALHERRCGVGQDPDCRRVSRYHDVDRAGRDRQLVEPSGGSVTFFDDTTTFGTLPLLGRFFARLAN